MITKIIQRYRIWLTRKKLLVITRLLKKEIEVYKMVYKDSRTPLISKILLWIAVFYVALPFDIIPDSIPVVGQLDDVFLVPVIFAVALLFIPKAVIDDSRQKVKLQMRSTLKTKYAN